MAIQLDPASPHERVDLGNMLANQQGRYEEAEQASRKAIQSGPRPLGKEQFGNLLRLLYTGRFAEATDAFRRALELDPSNPWPRFSLAKLLARSEPEFALEEPRKAANSEQTGSANRWLTHATHLVRNSSHW